jgi:hypothetical protein
LLPRKSGIAGATPHLALLIGKDFLYSLTKGRVIVKRDIPEVKG